MIPSIEMCFLIAIQSDANNIIIKSHCSFKGGLCNVGLKTNFPPNSYDGLTLHCPGNTILF